MKYILIDESNVVVEIIPEFVQEFPGLAVSQRYPANFVASLFSVEDDAIVEPSWVYDASTGAFHEQQPPEKEYVPAKMIGDEMRELQAQLKAAVETNAFLEECIVEMAGIVYA